MKVKIEINTDNAAFEGPWWGFELVRILDKLENRLLSCTGNPGPGWVVVLRDSNGNRVGTLTVEE